MALFGFTVGAGAVIAVTVGRTLASVVLSVRNHRRGDEAPSIALTTLSDGILASGAILYAEAALIDDAQRPLMASLLVFAVAWEAYSGPARIAAENGAHAQAPGAESLSPFDDLLVFMEYFAWVFTTLMLVMLCGSVVALRPETTDSQKLAPIVGVSVPIVAGLLFGNYIEGRVQDRWTKADTAKFLIMAGMLAFAVWAWL